jgi:hypothetical protein
MLSAAIRSGTLMISGNTLRKIDSLQAADRLIAEIFEAFESLARNPGIGHKREDLTKFPVLF